MAYIGRSSANAQLWAETIQNENSAKKQFDAITGLSSTEKFYKG
jgi:hypothetical protein